MSFFCFLWIPIFELFWLSLTPHKRRGTGGVLAFFLGTLSALVQYFNGPFIKTGGFGFIRWVSALVDYVGLPVGLPLLTYGALCLLRIISSTEDMTNFSLLWLIPEAALCSISWSTQQNPLRLLLVPLLWTASSVAIPFFIGLYQESMSRKGILALIAIPIHFGAAVTAYWAFFIHSHSLGYGLLLPALIPALATLGLYAYQVASAKQAAGGSA